MTRFLPMVATWLDGDGSPSASPCGWRCFQLGLFFLPSSALLGSLLFVKIHRVGQLLFFKFITHRCPGDFLSLLSVKQRIRQGLVALKILQGRSVVTLPFQGLAYAVARLFL